MSFASKVVVAIDFNNEIQNLLSNMKEMDFLNNSEVHFVHIASQITYAFVFNNVPLVYPIEDDRKVIEQSYLEKLTKLSKEILPSKFAGKVSVHCFFSENPKQSFVDYVNDEKANLIIIATRERRGFFESSFASHIDKNTKANVLLIKHQ